MKSRGWCLCAGLTLALAWSALPVRADYPSLIAASLIEKATGDEADGKHELAMAEASAALSLDSHNTTALDLRASIYVDEKLWSRAERDYTTLNRFSPAPAYRYKLAQIQFLQKHYDDARPLFAALRDESGLGDLAGYKVFVCDLFGAHESIAARDLGTLDTSGRKPSFYFGRAVWDLFHQQQAEAARLYAQAQGRFDTTIVALYLEPLADLHPFRASVASFNTRDGRNFNKAQVFLESKGLRAFNGDGWVTLPLNQLPDDLSSFPEDMRQQIHLQRDAVPAPAKNADAPSISFTTRSGKIYQQVRWRLGDTGLDVLTPNGWTLIVLDDLPADLSAFPDGLQKQLAQRGAKADSATPSVRLVSFTTRQGRSFDSVHASLGDDGVLLLTPNGLITIPFADLPADLSPFPVGWRPTIQAVLESKSVEVNDSATVSFSTREGKAYRDVNATLVNEGVMLVTPDGLVTVPVADFPDGLSPFPDTWRPLIKKMIKSNDTDISRMRIVSFTSRHGKNYDKVRAQLDGSGLRVLGSDGWVVVPYDQLPADLSSFPTGWQKAIAMRVTSGTQPD